MSAGLGKSIFAQLTSAADVAALVGTRVYPLIQPQPAIAPSIVYQVVIDTPLNTLDGCNAADIYQSRVQIDAYGNTYAEAQAVADAANAVFGSQKSQRFTSVRLTRRDLYESDTKLHRVSMDFSIWSDL